MNVGTKFETRPMGPSTLIGILILTAAYLGLVVAMLVVIKGTSVLDPIAPLGQTVMAWIGNITCATPPAGH